MIENAKDRSGNSGRDHAVVPYPTEATAPSHARAGATPISGPWAKPA